MFIEAGNQFEILASSGLVFLGASHPNFFEGFETIRDKGWADHEKFVVSPFAVGFQHLIGVGLQPWVFAESGLEGDTVLFVGNASGFDKFFSRSEALVAVAGRVGRVTGRTAIFDDHAVFVRRVTFP